MAASQDSDISGETGSAMYTTCMHIFDADLSEYTYDYADDVNRYMQFLKTCPGGNCTVKGPQSQAQSASMPDSLPR